MADESDTQTLVDACTLGRRAVVAEKALRRVVRMAEEPAMPLRPQTVCENVGRVAAAALDESDRLQGKPPGTWRAT